MHELRPACDFLHFYRPTQGDASAADRIYFFVLKAPSPNAVNDFLHATVTEFWSCFSRCLSNLVAVLIFGFPVAGSSLRLG